MALRFCGKGNQQVPDHRNFDTKNVRHSLTIKKGYEIIDMIRLDMIAHSRSSASFHMEGMGVTRPCPRRSGWKCARLRSPRPLKSHPPITLFRRTFRKKEVSPSTGCTKSNAPTSKQEHARIRLVVAQVKQKLDFPWLRVPRFTLEVEEIHKAESITWSKSVQTTS